MNENNKNLRVKTEKRFFKNCLITVKHIKTWKI